MRALALLAAVSAGTAPAADRPPFAHKVLAADRGAGKLVVLAPGGNVEWEYATKHDIHDAHVLPNGNILTHTSHTTVVEINPAKQIVWKYEAKPKPGYRGRVEVHAFQRLAGGLTLVAESGNARLVEVDRAGTIVKEVPLSVPKPDAHRDTRLVRKLATGNYLVCHEGLGLVREYNGAGATVWEYSLDLAGRPAADGHGPEGHGTSLFGAVRLANGNTLIAGGNNNRVVEVTPDKKIVWELNHRDIPGVTLAWVTTLQVLPSGNIVVGNCHAGRGQPQLIEVTRDKKLVGALSDFAHLGNDTATAVVLGVPGVVR